MVERADIIHLAELSRLELDEAEIDGLLEQLSAIVDYVSVIQSLTIDDVSTKQLGVRANVMRGDVVTNASGRHREDLLRAAPQTERGYVVVQKILQADEGSES